MSALLQSIQRDAAALQTLHHALAQDPKVLAVFAECAERIMRCDDDDRVVYASGIGKSGIVAQRFASTLASISVRSRKCRGSMAASGRMANWAICAVVTCATSPLGLQSDVALVAPATDNAACPVPSRSIVVQESICNALVEQLVTSMEGRATKFRQNHPGGSIGDSIW
uniref:SIS domain-containing protein n=1 Tax=Globisporangium ultimum (strain ATCC 200006 / CBS 805.95 / DAOM BR144) TaxID=431595 RepID=K3WZ75_GLOUD